jgi:hypothetical protein
MLWLLEFSQDTDVAAHPMPKYQVVMMISSIISQFIFFAVCRAFIASLEVEP